MIGAETFSRILDWDDRTTCVLFGDGAGAVVLEAQEQPRRDQRPRHPHLASALGRPAQGEAVSSTAALHRRRTVGHLRMEGKEVFKHAVGMITDVIDDAVQGDRDVPPTTSTGSFRIRPTSASSTPRRTSSTLRREKVVPPSTDTATPRPPRFRWRFDAVADGRIKKGDLVLFEAMGGGFTWGSVLVRW